MTDRISWGKMNLQDSQSSEKNIREHSTHNTDKATGMAKKSVKRSKPQKKI